MYSLRWQMHDANEWRFGKMVRGVVRTPYLAEIYFSDGGDYPWIWIVRNGDGATVVKGSANYFENALQRAEAALQEHGIILPVES